MALLLPFALLCTLHSVLAESPDSSDFNRSTSVEYDIYRHGQGPGRELPQVYESLINCPDTKSLRIRLYSYFQNLEEDPLNFKFSTGDQFPQLREISLDGYEFGDYRLVRGQARRDQAQTVMKPMLLETIEDNHLPQSQNVYIPGANIEAWTAVME